jgi:hypothetical protein
MSDLPGEKSQVNVVPAADGQAAEQHFGALLVFETVFETDCFELQRAA